MAVDAEGNEIAEEIIKTPEETIADTVKVDDITHANTDLDKRLDELAGRKPNEATKTTTEAPVPAKPAVVPNGKDTQQQGTPAATPTERPVSESRRPAFSPRAYPKAYAVDRSNNVIDAATGAIVATAGGNRTAFEKMLPYIESVRSQGEKFQLALEAANKANTIASGLGLSAEEFTLGGRIISAFKSDPKKAIDFLIKEAQSNGVDTSDIAAGGSGVSIPALMAAIEEKLNEKLKPFSFITEEREQSIREQQGHQAAEQGVNELLAEYPDAELHGMNIARVMDHHVQQGKDISMREAYLIVRNYAYENGFDFKKDLTPQAQAKAAKLAGTTVIAPAPNAVIPPRTSAIPNMTGREGNSSVIPKPAQVASGLMDTADIVRESMREQGIQI